MLSNNITEKDRVAIMMATHQVSRFASQQITWKFLRDHALKISDINFEIVGIMRKLNVPDINLKIIDETVEYCICHRRYLLHQIVELVIKKSVD